MRLIIDSVNASNFIEKSIATKMIDKKNEPKKKVSNEP